MNSDLKKIEITVRFVQLVPEARCNGKYDIFDNGTVLLPNMQIVCHGYVYGAGVFSIYRDIAEGFLSRAYNM